MSMTPIAYIIFNRPRHTSRSFAAIRAQRPRTLFIIADGPRPESPTDPQRCQEVRQIVEQIDWPCDVYRNYADHNLGCRQRVISGLDWVFDHTDEAIIIEDDVLPHPDFYEFCERLLDYYRHDERVACITGCNFQDGQKRGTAAYYFSKHNHVWGWATWRRSWRTNNPPLDFWPKWKKSREWRLHTPEKFERMYWSAVFDQMYQNMIDTWDYSWTASIWYHGGLTATPNVNLVTNIGLGPDATHSVYADQQEGLPVFPLGVLTHPPCVEQDRSADSYVFDHHFGGQELRLLKKERQLHNRLARFSRRMAAMSLDLVKRINEKIGS